MRLSTSAWLRWAAFFVLGLLLFSLGRRHATALTPTAEPLPQDPYVQVYFNHSPASVYREPYRKIDRYGDDLEQIIVDALAQAQVSIEVAVHELNLPKVAEVLRDRAQAGVQVRLVLENTYSQPWSGISPAQLGQLDEYRQGKYSEFTALVDQNHDGNFSAQERAQRDALYILQQAQVPLIDDTADGSKGSGLMHHKFAVIDQRWVLTGSANWTISDIHGDFAAPESRGNANALLLIDSPAVAAVYREEFTQLWGDGPAGRKDSRFGLQKTQRGARSLLLPGTSVQVQFSPTSAAQSWPRSVNGLIAQTLSQAQRQVDLALFVFSEQALSDALAQAASRGVQVRALIDPGFVYRDYSEALDMLGVNLPNQTCHFEANNRPWHQPILTVGTPNLAPGDKLHHKFGLIDESTVIIGSQNWSKAANDTNDENLLVIRSPLLAAHFRREFERLYSSAELGITARLQATLNQRRRECGF